MKNNFWFFFIILLILFGISGVFYLIINSLQKNGAFGLVFLFRIASYAVSTILNIGLIAIALKFIGNEKPEIEDLFRSYKGRFWRFVGASLLYGLIVVGGLLLLIVPGIYWAIKFQFCTFLVVDQESRVTESLRRSSKITESQRWHLLGFGLLLGLINIAGALALLIGLFVTIPLTMIGYTSVYRKLQQQTEMAQPQETA